MKLKNGNEIITIDSLDNKRSNRCDEYFKNVKLDDIVIDRVIGIVNQEDFVNFEK